MSQKITIYNEANNELTMEVPRIPIKGDYLVLPNDNTLRIVKKIMLMNNKAVVITENIKHINKLKNIKNKRPKLTLQSKLQNISKKTIKINEKAVALTKLWKKESKKCKHQKYLNNADYCDHPETKTKCCLHTHCPLVKIQ
jgi:hypothetical protein